MDVVLKTHREIVHEGGAWCDAVAIKVGMVFLHWRHLTSLVLQFLSNALYLLQLVSEDHQEGGVREEGGAREVRGHERWEGHERGTRLRGTQNQTPHHFTP